jgi:hypothetical protein
MRAWPAWFAVLSFAPLASAALPLGAHAQIAPALVPGPREANAEKPSDPFDLTWRPSDQVWLRPGALLQARYTFDRRQHPVDGDADTSQFTVARARFIFDAGLTQYLSFRLRIGSLAQGGANFEQGYADLHFGPLIVRGGIFYLPASIADNPAPNQLQTLDYSQYGQQASGGQAAGVGARVDLGGLRGQAYVSNGARTAFTELATPLASRVALTGRAELSLFTKDGLGRFDTESSFLGSDLGLRVGGAAHYQKGTTSGQVAYDNLQQYSADLTLELSGFNAIAAGRFLRVAPPEDVQPGALTTHDGGLLLQVGGFVHEYIELWARYDGLYSDGKVHSQPPFANAATQPFHELGVGVNGYLIPRRSLSKLQLDFLYVPLPINATQAASSSNSGLLPTDRGAQWALRLQLTAAI